MDDLEKLKQLKSFQVWIPSQWFLSDSSLNITFPSDTLMFNIYFKVEWIRSESRTFKTTQKDEYENSNEQDWLFNSLRFLTKIIKDQYNKIRISDSIERNIEEESLFLALIETYKYISKCLINFKECEIDFNIHNLDENIKQKRLFRQNLIENIILDKEILEHYHSLLEFYNLLS